MILKENEWVNDDILIINSDLKKTYNLNNTFSSSLDETKCFVTDCENLIANDGSILISSNQIHEKKLNEFPQSLIILSDTRKLKIQSVKVFQKLNLKVKTYQQISQLLKILTQSKRIKIF